MFITWICAIFLMQTALKYINILLTIFDTNTIQMCHHCYMSYYYGDDNGDGAHIYAAH